MDPISLAIAAVAVVTPYLVVAGAPGAAEPTPDAGAAVWSLIKGWLTSAGGREAVADAETAPARPENAQALQAALAKVLRHDSEVAGTLAKLLNDRAASR